MRPFTDASVAAPLGGTGTHERDEERLTMVLTGSFEADGKRGSVTWQFSSTW